MNIILFIASLIFTKINTDPWQDAFYYLTLASALIFNSNDSIFQGAFASLIGRFPEKYMSSLALGKLSQLLNVKKGEKIHSGQAIGGTIASVISVSMLAIGGSDSNAALFSFSFATVFLLTVLILFSYASRQEFYTFYWAAADLDQKENQSSVDFKTVLKSTWTFNLAVFLNFLVTLGVFPSYHSLAQTTSTDPTWQRRDIHDIRADP